MRIEIPELCLVVLVGTSGSGKSTFASRHFKPTEVISSDYCRGLVCDDELDQSATNDAFDVLHYIAAKRLKSGRIAVIDATNVQPESRKPLVALAKANHCLPVAIVFDMPERVCVDRNVQRADRNFGDHVVRRQRQDLRRSIKGLEREGFRHIFTFRSEEEANEVVVERVRLWNNRKFDHGPFDIIGDIHGCFDELKDLLETMGYQIDMQSGDGPFGVAVTPPEGRKVVFLGDLVDRGPKIPQVLRLAMSMVASGSALCVAGNHDAKLMKKLRGRDVRITHGLAESLEQLDKEPPEFKDDVARFIDDLISHYVLDDGKLVVAHAGLKQEYQGRSSGKVREFCMYGETTGETDEYGLPVRFNWASEYRGQAMVVYGHTPVSEPEWTNKTINIDTGCVFGGRLTALRYPERELISIDSKEIYYEPSKPFLPEEKEAPRPQAHSVRDEILDIEDVSGKRIVNTRLQRNIIVRAENSTAALEVMSRFAVDPKWLVYLPPTMSPCETSSLPEVLEHPGEALSYYLKEGIASVICEEKHMGSRAVVIVCADEAEARKTFGAEGDSIGICYTRTGRRFFNQSQVERQLLESVSSALSASHFWDNLKTRWVILDCELMPWSAKAQQLIHDQYAAVGAAATEALSASVDALRQSRQNGAPIEELLNRFETRSNLVARYRNAYQSYCWPVNSITDLRLAPFQVLASKGRTHFDREHSWHMSIIHEACLQSPIMVATKFKTADVTNEESCAAVSAWWEEMVVCGGEGMVVKPMQPIAAGRRGIVQPGVKCRGPEYLRIIYGPEYTEESNISRLRARGLSAKRSMAIREFALGVEALERFVHEEPLYRIHECVFGVLALESEPVDPRL